MPTHVVASVKPDVEGPAHQLVVSDIQMPEMDGLDLTQRIKADPALSSIPVILVTSLDSADDRSAGLRVGADGYLIKREVERLNGLVTDFLQFARPRSPELLPTPPREIVESVVKLASKQAEQARVKIVVDVTEPLPLVLLDAEQMKQVLLNLILNAIEAMPEGGQLTISAGQRGEELSLAVRDTGKGIDPAVREKLFSPFVTTKSRGTGLGLAIAHRLVTQHGGRIEAADGQRIGAEDIERRPGEDRRTVIVHLTEAGRAKVDEVSETHMATERAILSALSPTQRDQLAGLLKKVLVSLGDDAPPS